MRKKLKTIGIVTGTLLSLYGGARLGIDIYESQQPIPKPQPINLGLMLEWNNNDCNVDTLPNEIIIYPQDAFGVYLEAEIEDNGHGRPRVGTIRQEKRLTDLLHGGQVKVTTRGYPDNAPPPSFTNESGEATLTLVPFLSYGCD